jgi:hypothetical protein
MTPASKSDEILACFPGPVELLPERRKWQWILAVNLVFVGAGFMLMFQGHRAGVYVVLAFALIAVIPAMIALPGAAKLVLDRDGFRATSLYRGRYTRWDEVSEFKVAAMARGGHRIVVYDDAGLVEGSHLMASSKYAGHNSAFPDSYGLTVQDLAELMNAWRERARTLSQTG